MIAFHPEALDEIERARLAARRYSRRIRVNDLHAQDQTRVETAPRSTKTRPAHRTSTTPSPAETRTEAPSRAGSPPLQARRLEPRWYLSAP
jgi:hypothetical protein